MRSGRCELGIEPNPVLVGATFVVRTLIPKRCYVPEIPRRKGEVAGLRNDASDFLAGGFGIIASPKLLNYRKVLTSEVLAIYKALLGPIPHKLHTRNGNCARILMRGR